MAYNKGMIWGLNIRDLPFDAVVRTSVEMWRVVDFWKKEPEMMAWIDSFEPDSVFWDVGANIGLFSLYASYKGHHSIAVEPVVENIGRILLNTSLNKGFDVKCIPYALSDTPGKSIFNVKLGGPGHSGGQVGSTVDEEGREFKPESSYEVDVTTIDLLAKDHGCPDYIKIDVDGLESKIIAGAVNTLNNHKLKGVSIEEKKNSGNIIDKVFDASGFTPWNRFNGEDINKGINSKTHNVIYTRSGHIGQ